MEASAIAEAVKRIRYMETCFSTLQKAETANAASITEDPVLREMLHVLVSYYESRQWLHDYELDEQGFLPPELKRGVLSQDAVYDFLFRINHPHF